MPKKAKQIIFLSTLLVHLACDREHKKKCEWFLIPDEDRTSTVSPGFIPVCARNLVVNRQDCRLQATLDFTKKNYSRKFRYVDMKIDGPGLPRTIVGVKFCSEKMAMFNDEEQTPPNDTAKAKTQ